MTYVNGGYIDLLSMNVKKAPFDDPKVREAVAMLIDRDGLNTPLFSGKGTLATSVTPSSLIDAMAGAAGIQKAAGRPTQATEVRRGRSEGRAGRIDPQGRVLGSHTVDTTQPWMLPLAQNLAENAKPLGITIEVKSVSAAEWADALFSPDRGPLQLVALGSSSPNIASIAPLLVGEGSINVSEYSTPEIVKNMATLSSSTDAAALSGALAPSMAEINTSLAYFPLYRRAGRVRAEQEPGLVGRLLTLGTWTDVAAFHQGGELGAFVCRWKVTHAGAA